MTSFEVNLPAVVTCSFLAFLLGAFWYSPFLFGKKWAALVGTSDEQVKASPPRYVLALLLSFMACYALAFVISLSNVHTLLDGALIGAICWIGFTASTGYTNQVIFLHRSSGIWFIVSGHNLVSFVISGGILAVWK